MLYPTNYQYLIDVLAYIAVGARSVENQEHRLVASGVPMPVGMKNPTGGSTDVMLNSIYAAQQPQTFIFRNWEVSTTGNPLAHAVLRGYVGSTASTTPTTTTSTWSAWRRSTPPRALRAPPPSSTATTTTPASARSSRFASATRCSTP